MSNYRPQRVRSVASVIVDRVQQAPRALLVSLSLSRAEENKNEEHSILPSTACYKYVPP